MEFTKKNPKTGEDKGYKILIAKENINFVRAGCEKSCSLYSKKNGELVWVYSPHVSSEGGLREVKIPFLKKINP